MPDLNYHHLRYFRVVAHTGHLTRAAETLNVSQSALSAQIRQLEERLGQALFERRGRALHLTEAGRIALDHADAIFAAGHELLATLKQTGEARRAVRIGAIATLSRNFQLRFLQPVLGRSDVEVILHSGSGPDLLGALADLNLDVVLTSQPPQPEARTAYTLSPSPYVVQPLDQQPASLIGVPGLCPPGEPDLRRLLADTPLIVPTRSSGLRMAFDALAARLEIRPQFAAEVDDMAMMRLLTREGIGLAVLPPIVVQDELKSGLLSEVSRLPGISETFYAVTTPRKFPNPVVQDLIRQAAQPG
ncbi:LysR family transcriptional regulator [Novispirillum itersonii]|uniref:LysR family transcriptional activator of nhaA n=1 Tax=Novispirillum itersonii TaxID=189 RepID=A0A7W9ZIF9_NOVIT|nr:LysR family transcriptional regulator [Novispirillum itersonii]MBB6211633.1 LysR family transcriptional activator of nhaA [Novispirillum itersonii]